MCTVDELHHFINEYDDDDLSMTGILTNDTDSADKIDNMFTFYSAYQSPRSEYLFTLTNTHEQTDVGVFYQNRSGISKHWILLDSQSTIDLFCNPDLLNNIREVSQSISVCCNAGTITTNTVGDLDGYGTVWYHEQGIANILSLYRVSLNFHIQYDSRSHNSFCVWKKDGTCREFKAGSRALYYCDTRKIGGTILTQTDEAENAPYSEQQEALIANEVNDPDIIPTVANNITRFTQRQVKDAYAARYFQNSASLSRQALIRLIDANVIKNSPITRDALRNAEAIWGISTAYLEGKISRKRNEPVQLHNEVITSIPPYILQHHQSVVLGMDIMKINSVPFLTTISRSIRFGTITELKTSHTMGNVIKAFSTITAIYRRRGFKVI